MKKFFSGGLFLPNELQDALGNLTPAEYREKLLKAKSSTLELSSCQLFFGQTLSQ
jgi:hypothetical protein